MKAVFTPSVCVSSIVLVPIYACTSDLSHCLCGGLPAFNHLLSGDGAGVGKGRQLAGIFLDNWERGRCNKTTARPDLTVPPQLGYPLSVPFVTLHLTSSFVTDGKVPGYLSLQILCV